MKVVADLFILCTKVVTWFFACCSSPLLPTSPVPPTIQLVNHGYGMQCKVCMQTFMCTTSEVKCREHAEAKHPKSDLYTCFPHLKKWQLICETRTLRFVLLARNCICYPSCYYLISFFMHLRSIYAKEFYDCLDKLLLLLLLYSLLDFWALKFSGISFLASCFAMKLIKKIKCPSQL